MSNTNRNQTVIGEAVPSIPWEEKPVDCKTVVWRSERNPIIPRDLLPTSNSIFNSAVVPFKGEFAGVFRCDNTARRMQLHSGRSRDGIDWQLEPEPIQFICEDQEIAFRIQSNNYKIKHSINSVVRTTAPSGMRALLRQRVRWNRGYLRNLRKYKHLLGTGYGDLGTIVLPVGFAFILLSLVVVFYNAYATITDPYLMSEFIDSGFDLFYLQVSPFQIMLFITIALSMISMYLSVKHIQKDSGRIIFPYVLYLLIYWIIFTCRHRLIFYIQFKYFHDYFCNPFKQYNSRKNNKVKNSHYRIQKKTYKFIILYCQCFRH